MHEFVIRECEHYNGSSDFVVYLDDVIIADRIPRAILAFEYCSIAAKRLCKNKKYIIKSMFM